MGSWWSGPLCATLHLVGTAMLVGVVGVLDLRMLGMAKGLPLAPLRRLRLWAVLGFAINLVTGYFFFADNPRQYIGPPPNIAFVAKMFFIALVGVNAFLFYATGLSRAVDSVGGASDVPLGAKVYAGVSLFLWVGVMYWGRMLPFFANTF